MRRLFVPADQWAPSRAVLQGDAHHHLTRVLRARPGDPLILFDGAGGEVDAVIETIERDRTTLALGARRAVAVAGGARIVLLQSLARGERMDWIVQKTTELGVARIVPVAAERSVARLTSAEAPARRARWEKIAREAARQCGRADVPEVADPIPLADALAHSHTQLAASGGAGFALWEGSRGRPLRAGLADAGPDIALLIGPEGGLTALEIAAAEAATFQIVGLGPRILRVETAALVAVALAQASAGGLD